MRISIIHPTRNRDNIAFATMVKWLSNADRGLAIEYILSVDKDDPYYYEATFSCKVLRSDNNTAIEAINKAAEISTGDIIIVISDDFSCPKHWDTLLLNEVGERSDFLLKTNDTLQKTLVTLPILGRTYYERFGYIYHPDYLHLHCDEEMTIVALMLGKYLKCDLEFEHLHHTTGKSVRDEISIKNDSTWAHGQATLDRRAKDNFGIANPLIKREEIQWR